MFNCIVSQQLARQHALKVSRTLNLIGLDFDLTSCLYLPGIMFWQVCLKGTTMPEFLVINRFDATKRDIYETRLHKVPIFTFEYPTVRPWEDGETFTLKNIRSLRGSVAEDILRNNCIV